MKTSLNQSTPPVVAFIGGGNMAGALVGGMIRAGHPVECLRVAEPHAGRAETLRRLFGVSVESFPAQIVGGAQAVVLAVKPQQMSLALAGVALDPGTAVVSIAAGVRIKTLKRWLGEAVHYIRTMPNTPALLNQGITAMYTPKDTPQRPRDLAETILRAAGEILWIDREENLDVVTALSGSGPAYFFLLTELMREAGHKLGLDARTTARLARQTFVGAAAMAAGDTDVAELRAQVTSRGGTTEAALRVLESSGIRAIFLEALTAAALRGRELGHDIDQEP